MELEKIKDVLYKIMLIVLFILVSYVTYCSVFDVYADSINMKTFIIIIGVITCICVFIRLKKLINKISEKKANIISIILCLLFFICLSVFGSRVTAIPTYDLSDIQKEVQIMLENGGKFVDDAEYFAVYTAQQPVAILIYYIYKLGVLLGVSNLRIFATIINSAFISIAAFFTYLSVKRLKDYKVAFITLVFFIINPIFYFYNSWFYTDTFCMPFAAISIYLFLVATKKEKFYKSFICYAASGLVLALGFKIRVVIGIILIAMIMGLWLNNKISKRFIVNIVAILLGFIIGFMIWKIIYIPFNTETDKNKEFPPTHWVMMALNVDAHGAWNREDFLGTLEKSTYSDKVYYNIDVIKARLDEMGIKGWLEFAKIKLARAWSNGAYDYTSKIDNVEEINKIYEYVAGNKKVFAIYYTQIMKATVMFLLLVFLFKEIYIRDKEKNYNVISISILGAFMFYLLWEVCPRYSLTFLPWIMLTFGIGITQIERILELDIIELSINNTKKKINMRNIHSISMRTIFICTIFLLIINFFELCVDKSYFWDRRVVVQTTNNIDTQDIKISDNKIKQTFKTSKSFNHVSIRFTNKDTCSKTNYKFILYNSKGNEIYEEEFDSDSVKNKEFKGFNIERQYPDGEEEYTMQIYSDDATDSNSIGVLAMCVDKFSIYPDGKVEINDEYKDIDLQFRIQNKRKRTYFRKSEYIVLSLFIVLLQVYGINPFLFKNKQKLLKGEENSK